MRRYRVEVGGTTHVIDVNELSAHEFQVRVGDRSYTVTLSAAEEVAEAVITPDIAAVADRNGDDVGQRGGALSTAKFRPPAPDRLRTMVPAAPPPLPPSPDRPAGSVGVVKAPMPGTVTAVEVAPGAAVRTGDVLLKLEAMKMSNAIKSPRDGVVAEVAVQAGQSVGYGHVLVVFRQD